MNIKPTRNWLFPFICLLITIYFVFHGIEGNHGIRRMTTVQEEIRQANIIAKETEQKKELLKTKVNALSSRLDMDQLEESALRILNVGDEENKVIYQ